MFVIGNGSAGSPANALTVLKNGNVGIGTASPASKLDVAGAVRATSYKYPNGNDFINSQNRIYYPNGTIWNDGKNMVIPADGWLYGINDALPIIKYNGEIWVNAGLRDSVASFGSSGNILSSTVTGVSWISPAVISPWVISSPNIYYNGGNVGIGTDVPAARLDLGQLPASTEGLRIKIGATTPSSPLVVVKAGGTDAFRVKEDGNVGIGTPAPGNILEVYGNKPIIKYNRAGLYSWEAGVGNGSAIPISYYGIRNITRNDIGFVIAYNTGNVGIGTASPGAKLDVMAAVRTGTHSTGQTFYVTGTLATGQTGPATGNIEFRHNNATQGVGFGYNTIYQTGTNTNQELNILSRGTGPITLNAYPYSTGNVGIGTAAPGFPLEVNGTIAITNTAGGGGNRIIQVKSQSASNHGDNLTIQAGNATGSTGQNGGNLSLVAGDTGDNAPGNVYIYGGNDIVSPGNFGKIGLAFTSSGVARGTVGVGRLGGSPRLSINGNLAVGAAYTGGAPANGAIIEGNVGIGTTNPGTYKLNIAGTGYLGAAEWVYGSDKRLKENIAYFNGVSGLNKIIELKPAKFDYIGGDKNQLGFIAQDVQGVIPEAVVADKTTGMLGLKTNFIVPYLVEAVKELAAALDNLAAKVEDLFKKYLSHDERIQTLERENIQLQQQLNDLENQMQTIKNR